MCVNIKKDEQDREFAPGMVLTIEPGLYIAEDAPVAEQYRGIGIRIEDDVLVTEKRARKPQCQRTKRHCRHRSTNAGELKGAAH